MYNHCMTLLLPTLLFKLYLLYCTLYLLYCMHLLLYYFTLKLPARSAAASLLALLPQCYPLRY